MVTCLVSQSAEVKDHRGKAMSLQYDTTISRKFTEEEELGGASQKDKTEKVELRVRFGSSLS